MKMLLVVGYGNMAKAILAQNTFIAQHYHLLISGRDSQKIQNFISSNHLNAQAFLTTQEQGQYVLDCENKDILLCTKPKGLESFIFKGKADNVYSVLAGVGIAYIQSHIQSHCIIRLMPNIAAHSKSSATAFYYCHQNNLDSILQREIRAFIESFGSAVRVDNEILIESSIATSGSAIAFLSLVAESLIDAGVLEGLTHAQSEALVKQCFAGFAKELAHKSPSELKYAISSPGGTTIRGLSALEECGVRGAFIKAAHIAAQYAKDCATSSNPTLDSHSSHK